MEDKIKDIEALDNKCPNCNASISYNPKTSSWKCEYCNSSFTLEELKKYNNASSQKNNDDINLERDTYDNYISYQCKNCGAEIVADEQTAATFCVYCGNTAILKEKLSNEFKPNLIIPFKTTKKEAEEKFKYISKGRPLVPKGFNNEENIEKIRGVYIPFWLFDIDYFGKINCTAKNVKTWTIGDTHYTKTDVYDVEREGNVCFDKVPADGSSRFDNDIMNAIEPFNYEELINYNHAYLSGFLAERYDEDSNKVIDNIKGRCETTAINDLLNSVNGYTSKKINRQELKIINETSNYVLLPVWMINVKYNNKMYIFAMNGQTGKFIGNIPVDIKKAVLYGISIFIGVFLIIILLSYIIFIMGGN